MKIKKFYSLVICTFLLTLTQHLHSAQEDIQQEAFSANECPTFEEKTICDEVLDSYNGIGTMHMIRTHIKGRFEVVGALEAQDIVVSGPTFITGSVRIEDAIFMDHVTVFGRLESSNCIYEKGITIHTDAVGFTSDIIRSLTVYPLNKEMQYIDLDTNGKPLAILGPLKVVSGKGFVVKRSPSIFLAGQPEGATVLGDE